MTLLSQSAIPFVQGAPDTISRLRAEHRLLLQVLQSFERALIAPTPEDATDFTRFFLEFADGHHHRHEEEVLFEALRRLGAVVTGDPVSVMEEEHDIGRDLLGDLARLATRSRECGEVPAAFGDTARRYARLLRHHVDKEEHCLFGAAAEIHELEQATVMGELEARWRTPARARESEELLALALELEGRHP